MLEAAGIAYGRLSSLDDLEQHPQSRFMSVATPTGTIDLLAPGALHDGTPLAPGPVPAIERARGVDPGRICRMSLNR